MSLVIVEREGHVGVVRMNRPDKHNAFNRALSTAVAEAFDVLEADDDIFVAVLTGSGKAFSAGADMGEAVAAMDRTGRSDGMAQTIMRIAQARKPVLACVNGIAHGGGAFLAVTCDLRIASDTAAFRFPGASYGIVVGGAQLPRIVGPAYAKELLFTGRVVQAEEALAIGLVNRVAPLADVEAVTMDMARQIAANSPQALVATKNVVDRATEADEAMQAEMEWNRELRQSADHSERFRAAAERVAKRGSF